MTRAPGIFVAVALSLCAWSLAADAQQSTKAARVAVLSDESPSLGAKSFEPFAQGLRDFGWVEGKNIMFERRYATGNDEALTSLAEELIRLQPDVIFAVGTAAAQAAKNATQTIPIVFARSADPIGFGLVTSLARPGGNLTGLSDQMVETGGKRLELLVTAVPDAKRVGVFWAPPSTRTAVGEIERAAHSLGKEVISVEVRGREGLEQAFRAVAERHVGALIVVPGVVFTEHLQRITDLTANARLPAIFPRKEFVEAGGLMSYGPPDMYKFGRAAAYVDKILKGAKPADLPVEQPTKFELVINLKTATALGVTIPPILLARADEVIE